MPAKAASPTKKRAVRKADVPEVNKRLAIAGDKRTRKPVTKYTDLGVASAIKKKTIVPKGKGKKLEDCENVAKQINKRPKSSALLRKIHTILLGKPGTEDNVKENLLKFSGVSYEDEADKKKLEGKLEKQKADDLKDILRFFGTEPPAKKSDAIDAIVEFAEKPHATEHPAASPKKRKASKSPSSRSKSPKKSKSGKSKSKKDGPKRPKTAYFFFMDDVRSDLVKKYPKEGVTDIAKRMGAKWKKLAAADKKKYQDKAAKAKKQYEKEISKK